ncbi:MAG: hypothetical protein KJT01_15890 [Gemmatimonadetes bacterium]|nr:hypothetical protein [Gemmatimonadota bacterium]
MTKAAAMAAVVKAAAMATVTKAAAMALAVLVAAPGALVPTAVGAQAGVGATTAPGPSAAAREGERPRIDLRAEARADSARVQATVAVRGVLEPERFDPLLRSGFPARLRVRAELWHEGRWVDDLVAGSDWELAIRYDAVDASYEVWRVADGAVTPLGSYRRFADARAAMELPVQATLRPKRGRQGYVTVLAELQVLEVSDLDEVMRWLRGEAAPAARGRRNPGGALLGGVRTLATRVLGGEVRRLEARSAPMRW